MQASLKQYESTITNEYQLLVDWNDEKDEEFLFQWAGHKAYTYPISVSQIKSRIESGARIFTINLDGNIVGSVELDKVDLDNSTANACWFIICENMKNKGIGESALNALIKIAFDKMRINKLTLGVFAFNIGAIRCYEKCGFLVKEYFEGEDPKWNGYIMELRTSNL